VSLSAFGRILLSVHVLNALASAPFSCVSQTTAKFSDASYVPSAAEQAAEQQRMQVSLLAFVLSCMVSQAVRILTGFFRVVDSAGGG
jgi:hypothetical protein